jgi:hypothetical protein
MIIVMVSSVVNVGKNMDSELRIMICLEKVKKT